MVRIPFSARSPPLLNTQSFHKEKSRHRGKPGRLESSMEKIRR